MSAPHPSLPPLHTWPGRILALPRDPRGYPIPWFVADVNGVRDFRIIDFERLRQAVHHRLCMICGGVLGKYFAFTIGPMCAVNRVSSEPPSHRECAEFSARACPFLTKPHMRRREAGLPPAEELGPDRGLPIKRNPGVVLVWVTTRYTPFAARGGTLFRVGDPHTLLWFAEGRPATRAEILESIDTGLPLLREACGQEQFPDLVARAHRAIDAQVAAALTLLPAE